MLYPCTIHMFLPLLTLYYIALQGHMCHSNRIFRKKVADWRIGLRLLKRSRNRWNAPNAIAAILFSPVRLHIYFPWNPCLFCLLTRLAHIIHNSMRSPKTGPSHWDLRSGWLYSQHDKLTCDSNSWQAKTNLLYCRLRVGYVEWPFACHEQVRIKSDGFNFSVCFFHWA